MGLKGTPSSRPTDVSFASPSPPSLRAAGPGPRAAAALRGLRPLGRPRGLAAPPRWPGAHDAPGRRLPPLRLAPLRIAGPGRAQRRRQHAAAVRGGRELRERAVGLLCRRRGVGAQQRRRRRPSAAAARARGGPRTPQRGRRLQRGGAQRRAGGRAHGADQRGRERDEQGRPGRKTAGGAGGGGQGGGGSGAGGGPPQ